MEKNKLIAEFMGATVNGGCINYPQPHFKIKLWFANELQYHTSWDWLMPVVEKIEATTEWTVSIAQQHCFINKSITGQETFADTKIEAVYNAVVKFIE